MSRDWKPPFLGVRLVLGRVGGGHLNHFCCERVRTEPFRQKLWDFFVGKFSGNLYSFTLPRCSERMDYLPIHEVHMKMIEHGHIQAKMVISKTGLSQWRTGPDFWGDDAYVTW